MPSLAPGECPAAVAVQTQLGWHTGRKEPVQSVKGPIVAQYLNQVGEMVVRSPGTVATEVTVPYPLPRYNRHQCRGEL